MGPGGSLNVDKFQKAILQYHNTPDKDTKLSPAMCIFGRPIKDFIPILPGKYRPHSVWEESLLAREEALRRCHMINHELWTQHTRLLPPLSVGDHVRIQNQMGNYPTKWDKTGVIIEVRQYHQYVIRVDGSGRITIRNSKFLCKYTPIHQPDRRRCILDDLKYLPSSNLFRSIICPPTLVDVPIQSDIPSSSNSSTPPVSPQSADQHLLTAQTIPPCSPGSLSGPPTTTPTVTPPSSTSPPQALDPEVSPQPPNAELEPSPIVLRCSNGIRKPQNGILQMITSYIKCQSIPYFLCYKLGGDREYGHYNLKNTEH